jgi:anti-sigma B factor antagonist
MQLSERQVLGISVIDISASSTTPDLNPAALRERVNALLLGGHRRIVLSFEGVRNIDSSWLGEVVESYKLSTSNGAILKLAGVGPQLRSLLHTTGLKSVLESYDTDQEAVASFAGEALPEPGRTMLSGSPVLPDPSGDSTPARR